MNPEENKITIPASRVHGKIGLAFASVIGAIYCGTAIGKGEDRLLIFIVPIVLLLAAILHFVLIRRCYLAVDSKEIREHFVFNNHTLHWRDIVAVGLGRVDGVETIVFTLKDGRKESALSTYDACLAGSYRIKNSELLQVLERHKPTP